MTTWMEARSELVAVLDANVLYPMPLCDTILTCAEVELFTPRWSADILEEVRRNLVADGRCTPAKALRRIAIMNAAFPEADVRGYEGLTDAMTNEEGDRHVLAAAIRSDADCIVTRNLRDFPLSSREHYGLRAISPDRFLLDLLETDPFAVRSAIKEQAFALRAPALPVHGLLQLLRADAPSFCDAFVARFPSFPNAIRIEGSMRVYRDPADVEAGND
jgi:predicted nucleic acid-binding protein